MTENLDRERQYVGDGWQPIIDRLDAQLRGIIPGYKIAQIKEKFGGLRYYISHPPSTPEDVAILARDLIFAAEDESLHVCEHCGAPGECKGPGWYKTLCEPCREARQIARENRLKGEQA